MQNFRFCASCAQLYQTQMGNITKRHTIAYNWHKNGNHYTSLAPNVADCTFYSNHVLSVCFLFDGLNNKQSCIWNVEFLWITRICSIAVNLVWYYSCSSKYSLACCWHILSFWYHGAVRLVGCTSNTIFVCLNCDNLKLLNCPWAVCERYMGSVYYRLLSSLVVWQFAKNLHGQDRFIYA